MKTVLCVLLCLGVALSNPLLTEDFVNKINAAQKQWVATTDNIFKNKTIDEIKSFLGVKLRKVPENIPRVSYKNLLLLADVPDNFDSRQKWGTCVHPIRDQARCGSCWAFGASEALSDRLCIASSGNTNQVLAPQDLVSCDDGNYGCDGGYLDEAWDYLARKGIVTESCWPYSSQSGNVESCRKSCKSSDQWVKYKAKNVRAFDSTDDIKLDILTNGPVETGFEVYQDFLSYKGGIYRYTSGGFLGGHAVKVVGWGNENGVKFWIAANSWKDSWGENGFFRIEEGQCGFDDDMIAGDAVVN